MKKRLLACLLIACACASAMLTEAYGEEWTGIIGVENAWMYADDALTQPIIAVPKQAQVTYEDAGEPVVSVQYADVSGYMPRTSIGIPAEEEWQGYDTGVVLCETLSLRAMPDSTSERIGVLTTGDRFVILTERDGFLLACTRAQDGELYKTGWVQAAYVAKNKGTLTTEAVVHARAFGAEDAPLVAEISAGTTLNCIDQVGEYYVVSLRGASAFIQKDEPVTLDGPARTAFGLE